MKPEPTQNELFHAELLKAKDEVVSLLHEFNERISQVTAAFLLRAEELKPELGEGYKGRIRRLVYRETPSNGEGSTKEKTTTESVVDEVRPLGKRACSICRKPGHRATTCPSKGKS